MTDDDFDLFKPASARATIKKSGKPVRFKLGWLMFHTMDGWTREEMESVSIDENLFARFSGNSGMGDYFCFNRKAKINKEKLLKLISKIDKRGNDREKSEQEMLEAYL